MHEGFEAFILVLAFTLMMMILAIWSQSYLNIY